MLSRFFLKCKFFYIVLMAEKQNNMIIYIAIDLKLNKIQISEKGNKIQDNKNQNLENYFL